jgi:hypothetical protein
MITLIYNTLLAMVFDFGYGWPSWLVGGILAITVIADAVLFAVLIVWLL